MRVLRLIGTPRPETRLRHLQNVRHVTTGVHSLTLNTALRHGSVGMVDNVMSLFSEMNLLCATFLASARLSILPLCICLYRDILIQIPHSVFNLTNKGSSYHTLAG